MAAVGIQNGSSKDKAEFFVQNIMWISQIFQQLPMFNKVVSASENNLEFYQ